MPKSESEKKKAQFDDEAKDDPKDSASASSSTPAFQRQTEGRISLNLAARMKKRVTETRATLDQEHPEAIRRKEREKMRVYVNKLLEHPWHSNASFAVCAIIIAMIVLSTITCCAETLPAFETEYWQHWFWVADVVFVIFFTIEYGIRMWAHDASGSKKNFATKPLNVIDLVALIPFYIELVVWLFFTSAHSNEFFKNIQFIRVLRFIRVGRFSSNMIFIGEGLARSVHFFVLLAYMLGVGVLVSSAFLYNLEQGQWDAKKGCYARKGEVFFSGCSPFESVPISAWWAITTMTTVGYGDAYPLTLGGRIAAGFTMVCGLLTVAIPTTVLGVEFALAYKQQLIEKKERFVRKSLTSRTRDELILYQSMTKFNNLTEELRCHLPYLKHLAMYDIEMNLPQEDHPSIDPMFGLFQNEVMTNLYNLKLVAQAVTNNLIF